MINDKQVKPLNFSNPVELAVEDTELNEAELDAVNGGTKIGAYHIAKQIVKAQTDIVRAVGESILKAVGK